MRCLARIELPLTWASATCHGPNDPDGCAVRNDISQSKRPPIDQHSNWRFSVPPITHE